MRDIKDIQTAQIVIRDLLNAVENLKKEVKFLVERIAKLEKKVGN